MVLQHTSSPILCVVLLLIGSASAQLLTPPPAPEVPPIISASYPSDKDGDRITDNLVIPSGGAELELEPLPGTVLGTAPGAVVKVELIFKQQITQKQINDFLALGGEITFLYRAVSYGWQGRIPITLVSFLPAVLGDTLVLVKGAELLTLEMDVATQTGRVRPIWKGSLTGNTVGFDGDPNITIGIIDSGVDGSHPDLVGRCVYWVDESDDAARSANAAGIGGVSVGMSDYVGHGSHVAGIALGTGESGGKDKGPFLYTNMENLQGAASSGFYPFPLSLPDAPLRMEAKAVWTGGSTGTLKLLQSLLGTANWLARDSVSGSSPLLLSSNLTPSSNYSYSLGLFNTGGQIRDYAVTASVTNYPAVDEFNKFRGVAPGCKWAAAKVERQDATWPKFYRCEDLWVHRAFDDFVTQSRMCGIKVINISLRNLWSACDFASVDQINTVVNNGIVVVLAAGNAGGEKENASRAISGFQYAAKAITVGASNDRNALTEYSSLGYESPANADEDYKPDLIAPGGSRRYTPIISVDSGNNDGPSLADQQKGDYAMMTGTSMSAPFVSGCAALVIQAMQTKGIAWEWGSDRLPRYVKMVLCATATETGSPREDGLFSTELQPQRAATGPMGFPSGKDPYEGYGLINPDAAVEAVSLTYSLYSIPKTSATPGSSPMDRRAWACTLCMPDEVLKPSEDSRFAVDLLLHNPAGGDFDLYLYSATPSLNGTPVLLGASTNSGVGLDESISDLDLLIREKAILVVKRVSGSGEFTLTTSVRVARAG